VNVRVLVLRRAGVLIGHTVDRHCSGTERHQRHVLLDMATGGCLIIRSVMAAPGLGQLGALYSPHFVCVTDLWLRVRGFEKHEGAAVMQEWIVFPSDAHLTASQRDNMAALEASTLPATTTTGTIT